MALLMVDQMVAATAGKWDFRTVLMMAVSTVDNMVDKTALLKVV